MANSTNHTLDEIMLIDKSNGEQNCVVPLTGEEETETPTNRQLLRKLKRLRKRKQLKLKAVKEEGLCREKKFYPHFSNIFKKDFLKGINVAILKENFPIEKITTEDKDTIKMKILQEIDSTPEGQPLPKILFSCIEEGIFISVVEDAQSVKWIENTFHNNQNVLDGHVLKVMPLDKVPKFVKVVFLTTDLYTNEISKFLKRLNLYNPQLKVLDWHFISYNKNPKYLRAYTFMVKPELCELIELNHRVAYTGIDLGNFAVKWYGRR